MMANERAYPATKSRWVAALAAVALFPACGDDDGTGDGDGNGGVIDAAPTADATAEADAATPTPDAATPTPDAATAAVTVVECGGVTPTQTIEMVDISFVPPTATVAAGDVVMWTNEDVVPHTVTSGDPGAADAGSIFDSGNMAVGDSFCLRFDAVGTYSYFCEIHPVQMDDGAITVE